MERETLSAALWWKWLDVNTIWNREWNLIKAGQKTGWKKHPDADRAFVCVQGSGELVLETTAAGNELRIPLGPGAVALAPRGVFFDLVAGPEGMVCSALSKFPVRVVEKG